MKKFILIFSFYFFSLHLFLCANTDNKENSILLTTSVVNEGFESGATPPAGWSLTSNSSFTWQTKLGDQFNVPHSGSYFARIEANPFQSPQNEWLISPYFDITETDSAFLSFAFKSNYNKHVTENNVDIWLKISTDSGNTWKNLWREEDYGVFNNTHWFVDTVDLSCYVNKSNLKIAFNYVGAQGALFDLDEIIIAKSDVVPVELTSFTASIKNNNVNLFWVTATETNNKGFEVYKKETGVRSQESDWEMIGFIPGNGTTTEVKSYTFIDKNLYSGNYSYRLKQIDYDGAFVYTEEVEAEIKVPLKFSLEQNYPNPFNPSTKINFTLSADSKVSMKIFNILGEEIKSVINTDLTAGVHTIDFNASGFTSGVYFYRIDVEGVDGSKYKSVKKMIFSK